MKLPALWIATAFDTGIGFASAAVAILAGLILVWRRRAASAWRLALLAWLALGGLAIKVDRVAVPGNHVPRLIANGAIDRSVPLRWRGRLREDPLKLPWVFATK